MTRSQRPGGMGRVRWPIRAARCAWFAIALSLVACAGSAAPSPSDEPLDPVGSWQLVAGHGRGGPVRLVEGWPITLTITGEGFNGTAACNGYGGRFEPRDGGGVTVIELGATAMDCGEPGVGDAEAAYLEALQAVDRVGGQRDGLVLTGPATELRFEPAAMPPTADVVGTVWVLDSLFVADVASAPQGEPATLELREDGTLTGSTGCRGFEGTWVEKGAQIQATSLAMDMTDCPPELVEQDGHVVSVIGDGFVPTADGDLLTLTDPGSIGLVYRVEGP